MRVGFLAARRFGGAASADSSFPNITAPGGSASFTANWVPVDGADGYLVYISSSSQAYPDAALYSYRYKATGQATSSLLINGIASGTYYVRIAAYVGSTVFDLGTEEPYTAS